MSALKNLFWIIADLLGFNALFRQRNKTAIPILMYHGIVEQKLSYFCWTILPVEKFYQQMQYLKKHYDCIPLTEAISGKNTNTEKPKVAITFDDGLLNNYHVACPILKNLQIPATLFVVPELSKQQKQIWADLLFQWLTAEPEKEIALPDTGFGTIPGSDIDDRVKRVDTILTTMKAMPETKRLATMAKIAAAVSSIETGENSPFRLMEPEQIRELANVNEFTIGAHTNTHPILAMQNKEEQRKEILGSINMLKQWGIPVTPIFAYPNGRAQDFTDETISLVQESGCQAAVSTIDGLHQPGDNPFRIKRVNIGGDISMAEFKARVSGLYYFITTKHDQ